VSPWACVSLRGVKTGTVLVVPKFERTIKRTMKGITRRGGTKRVDMVDKDTRYVLKEITRRV
jgi:hypothetical protein